MASKKRKPWNAGLVMPGLLDEPPTVVKPTPDTISPSHSTPAMPTKEKAQPTTPPPDKKA